MHVFLIAASMIISLFGFAGGGGSSSGGSSSSSSGSSSSSSGGGGSSWSSSHSSSRNRKLNKKDAKTEEMIETLSDLAVIIILAIYFIYAKKEMKKRNIPGKTPLSHTDVASMSAALEMVDHNDTEQEKFLHEEAKKIFVDYQNDWSTFNYDAIQNYTTDKYFQHACLMLELLKTMNRKNVVSDLVVLKTCLLTAVDNASSLPMKVRVLFKFSGTDGLVEYNTGNALHSDKVFNAGEIWNFFYDGKSLKLDSISQLSESYSHLMESIEKFAEENRLFYSPDWGRLALPIEGLIFNKSTFVTADINNHVIGMWDDCLIQMYTYSAKPGDADSYYLVGQINTHKTYKGVLILTRKKKSDLKKPHAYNEFKMEWEDFNKRFGVYASSEDALTAFELLNPAFMEMLYDKELPYNLEVIGNTIYFFAKVTEIDKDDYAELLDVLREAFKQLRM